LLYVIIDLLDCFERFTRIDGELAIDKEKKLE